MTKGRLLPNTVETSFLSPLLTNLFFASAINSDGLTGYMSSDRVPVSIRAT